MIQKVQEEQTKNSLGKCNKNISHYIDNVMENDMDNDNSSDSSDSSDEPMEVDNDNSGYEEASYKHQSS
jgi:hypothetical protein